MSTCITTAEDDKVVGIRDNACAERLPPSDEPPTFEEPVHVDVGKSESCTLRRRR